MSFNSVAAVTICSDYVAPLKKKSLSLFPLFPHLFAMKWWDHAMIIIFWMLSFKSAFNSPLSLSIKRLFSSSLLSNIRVVSSAYLRLLIFLPAILIPAYASSSLAFHMMYSAYKLNKQGDTIQFLKLLKTDLKVSIQQKQRKGEEKKKKNRNR